MLRLISRSNNLVVSLEEMVAHLRREDTDEDDPTIERMTLAATQAVEDYAGISLVDQVWDYYTDEFPWGDSATRNGAIWLPRPPLIEVLGVFYRDTIGFETSSSDFQWYAPSGDRPNKGCVYCSGSGSWPSTDGLSNAVRIRYRAGYVDESASPMLNYEGVVPELIKAAIMIYASALYQNREMSPDPKVLDQVLRGYRMESSLA